MKQNDNFHARLDELEDMLVITFIAQAMTVAADPMEEAELLFRAAKRLTERRVSSSESWQGRNGKSDAVQALDDLYERVRRQFERS